MVGDSAKATLEKIFNWLESQPKNKVDWSVNESLSASSANLDYLVDHEIIIRPSNNKALGVTI